MSEDIFLQCAQKKDVPLCCDHRYMLTIGKMGEEAFFDA